MSISFLVRIRNEQDTILQCLKSLEMMLPEWSGYEIVCVFHRCTDESESIVKEYIKTSPEGVSITLHYYEHEISRAGVENFVTDDKSIHSFVQYSRVCLSYCTKDYKFKWDADFVMTQELATWLKTNIDLKDLTPKQYQISCRFSNGGPVQKEPYLSNCLIDYVSYVFWEVPVSKHGNVTIDVPNDAYFIHDSSLAVTKSYWKSKPWFFTEPTPEADEVCSKYKKVIAFMGKDEPDGMARGSNPVCDEWFLKCRDFKFPQTAAVATKKEEVKAVEPVDEHRPLPTLHMITLFHTIPNLDYTHCAFTQKCVRFGRMMTQLGWTVIEYHNGESISEATEHVQILTADELHELTTASKNPKAFHGADAVIGTPCWTKFNERLIPAVVARAKKYDIICWPFGACHPDLMAAVPYTFSLESGVGYPESSMNYRIFETNAWMHFHLAKYGHINAGKNYWFVVPNYYDLRDWDIQLKPTADYILFFGRITELKGINVVCEIARNTKRSVIIVGAGDPEPYLQSCPQLKYLPPVNGRARSALLGNAYCMLMPTLFVEPFGM